MPTLPKLAGAGSGFKVAAIALTAFVLATLLWGLVRKVPIALAIEPKGAVIVVDNKTVQNGQKIGFGKKAVRIEAAGYVPYEITRRANLFSTLKLNVKLRPLPVAEKLSEGDFLRQDKQGKIFYRQGERLYIVSPQSKADLAITEPHFGNLQEIVFSPDGFLAWVKFADGSNGIYDFNRYNLTNQEFHRWDDGVTYAAWSTSSSAATPEKQRIVYLKDDVLYQTDPLRQITERVVDLSGENLGNGYLEWSSDEKVLLIVGGGGLYLLEPQTETLTPIARGGIASAMLAPDSQTVVFSKNGQLFAQKYSLVDPFSGDPKDIGKIEVEPIMPLNIPANAQNSGFVDGKTMVVAQNKQFVRVEIPSGKITKFYHQPQAGNPTLLKVSGDTAYFEMGGIYSLKLDSGEY